MPKKTRQGHVAVPKIDQTLSYPRRPFVYISAEPAQSTAAFGLKQKWVPDLNNKIPQLLERIREIKQQIEWELERQREKFNFILKGNKVLFDDKALHHHIQFRRPLSTYLRRARLVVVLTAPVIYALILPLSLLDLFLFVYQHICFPVYGIPKVIRKDYIFVDRGALAYLNLIEKINCIYCGYTVGLLTLAKEIGSRTERYWCPIKHANNIKDPDATYCDFAEFGDPEGYQQRIQSARMRSAESEGGPPF